MDSLPIPPVFRLRYLGLICPCLEKEGDNVARAALTTVSPLHVRWHRPEKSEGGAGAGAAAGAVMSSISGMFGGGGSSPGSSSSSSGSFRKEKAALTIIDTVSGPALHVQTDPDAQGSEEDEVTEEGEVIAAEPHRRTVPLRRIHSIKGAESGFLGMGGGASLIVVSGGKKGQGEEELLRFDALGADGKKDRGGERREEVLEKLGLVLDWARRRREAAGSGENEEGEENEDEEEFENDEEPTRRKGGAPKGRAAKAAYFAKKEIELKKIKREREKRKARYVKEAGGLKYTAVAMANREMS